MLSRYWREAVKCAGVRHVKLHGARLTCATLVHLQNVTIEVIAAWIGPKDVSLTLQLHAHSQSNALGAADDTLNRALVPR